MGKPLTKRHPVCGAQGRVPADRLAPGGKRAGRLALPGRQATLRGHRPAFPHPDEGLEQLLCAATAHKYMPNLHILEIFVNLMENESLI